MAIKLLKYVTNKRLTNW